jgi:hypothetical protein
MLGALRLSHLVEKRVPPETTTPNVDSAFSLGLLPEIVERVECPKKGPDGWSG